MGWFLCTIPKIGRVGKLNKGNLQLAIIFSKALSGISGSVDSLQQSSKQFHQAYLQEV